jgi:uncharacterized membrane protein
MKNIRFTSKPLLSIGVLSFAGLILLSLRVGFTGEGMFIFLLWNVFLATIPLLPAYYFSKYASQGRALLSTPWFIAWLLLFPNAPYLLTDFIHVHHRLDVPIWFDTAMLFCFVLSGFLAGIVSLHWIHKSLNILLSKATAWICITGSILLSSYGIYLGRVLRFNSWDIVFNSKQVLLLSFIHLQNSQAIAMTLTFSIVMTAVYGVFKIIYTNATDHETIIYK